MLQSLLVVLQEVVKHSMPGNFPPGIKKAPPAPSRRGEAVIAEKKSPVRKKVRIELSLLKR